MRAVAGADAAGVIGDRWIHATPETPGMKDQKFATLDALRQLFADLSASVGGSQDPSRDGAVHDEGRLGLALSDHSGAILDVAMDGKPYPLRFHGSQGSAKVDMHFTDYDQPMTTPTPPSDVLEVPAAPSV
jgi:hypothetical protein